MKRTILFLILISLLLFLAACGTANDNFEDDSKTEDNDTEIGKEAENEEGQDDQDDQDDQGSSVEEEQGDQSEGVSENAEEQGDKDLITETGIYNGQADPHTIEIETGNGPQAFQLTMESRDDVEHLTEGGEVTYSYYEDKEQLVIERIEPTE